MSPSPSLEFQSYVSNFFLSVFFPPVVAQKGLGMLTLRYFGLLLAVFSLIPSLSFPLTTFLRTASPSPSLDCVHRCQGGGGSGRARGRGRLERWSHPLNLDDEQMKESESWSQDFTDSSDFANTHAIFSSLSKYIRSVTNQQGVREVLPFHAKGVSNLHFSTSSLERAVSEDFLDAGQGTAEKNKGWKMRPVGSVRGSSFEDAKLSFEDVKKSLEKGTVIFNSAGAHISNTLAPATLAALDGLDGAAAGVCLNLYVTRNGAPTAAPPHTDKQDVLVFQTQGRKHWRIYSPVDASMKSHADPFARGKVS